MAVDVMDSQQGDDVIPITGLEELENHLRELLQSPDAEADEDLFDEVNLQLTGTWACWC